MLGQKFQSFQLEVPERPGFFGRDLAFDPHEGPIGVQFAGDGLRLDIEDARDGPGGLAGVLNFAGIGGQREGLDADGHFAHARVKNTAAFAIGLNGFFILTGGFLSQGRSEENLQVDRPANDRSQSDKKQEADQGHAETQ